MRGSRRLGFLSAVLVLIIAVLLAERAFAANTCSDPDKIILRLSSATNAHAELAYYQDDTPYAQTYDHDICWQSSADLSANLRFPTPTKSNCIVDLSSQTNAHAQVPTVPSTPYPSDAQVCYGDIECITCDATQGTCNVGGTPQPISASNYYCPAQYSCVVQLSGVTDAHLRECMQDTIYPVVRCCRPSSAAGTCGNGVLEAGEECDAGTANSDSGFCTTSCVRQVCAP